MTRGNDTSKWLLARSLELIAGARRSLGFDELLCALCLYNPPSRRRVSRAAKDLAELLKNLDSQVNEERVRKLLRPFANLNRTVGFVHESLKYAVLHEFPVLTDAAPPRQQEWNGVSRIEGVMLRTCVDYLMLDDFHWTEAIPNDEGARQELKMSQVDQKMRKHRRTQKWRRRFYWPSPDDGSDGDSENDLECKVFAGEEAERSSAFSRNNLTGSLLSSKTDPFGAFFNYAACCWTVHLRGAPVDFNLDDVPKLASPTSARHRAWAIESGCLNSWYPHGSLTSSPLFLFAGFGNVLMLEQQLDRLAQNGDGDIRPIVAAATTAIHCRNYGNLRALMNHRSTAMAMQTVEMLKSLAFKHGIVFNIHRDDLTEWTRLIRGLFDTLASDGIPSPNELLRDACVWLCMPIIEKLFEQAKADPAFQEQLMQPTNEKGPLGEVAWRGANGYRGDHVAILRYLCQQDGIEAHASNRKSCRNALGCCDADPKVEIIELLIDRFPWLAKRARRR